MSDRHVNVNVTGAAGDALDRAAKRNKHTYAEAVRRAVLVHEYLERVAREGGRIKVTDADGSNPREIVILG